MIKETITDAAAREKIKKGADTVANAVRSTLGYAGRPVLIQRGPVYEWTRDGVTVAKNIEELKDKVENGGAKVIKNAAENTNKQAGDGTSTASIITQEMLHGGLRGIEMGLDPVKIREGFETASKRIIEALQKTQTSVKTQEQMAAIATVASRDPKVGSEIASLYNVIGGDGVIVTEQFKGVGTESEIVDGLEVESGWHNRYFITNGQRERADLEDAYVLVTDYHIKRNQDIVDILEAMARKRSALVIIAQDVSGQALVTLIGNKMQGIIPNVVIKAPSYGEMQKDILEDICIVTGATFVSEQQGMKLDDVKIEHLGKVSKAQAEKSRTVLIGGAGDKDGVEDRIESVRQKMEKEEIEYRKKQLEKRMARLAGGIAIMRVGGHSDEEAKERQYLVEDAVNAVKAGIEEGVIAGGGFALYRAAESLKALVASTDDQSTRYAYEVVIQAAQSPCKQVLKNAGLTPEVIINGVNDRPSTAGGGGYNLATREYVGDMVSEGIVDTVKVARVALEQAASGAGLVTMMGVVVYDAPEEKK